MAASKEALVIALDVGPSMSTSSCLIESLQVINLILQRKLFSESKDEVMVVLFGTSASNNDLHNGNEYAHVSVEKPLAPVTFELIEFVQSLAAETKGVPADFIDALVVAMDELKRNTEGKKAFTSKRIILLSNLKEPFITDQLADIIAALKESGFAFNYIGPCFDDALKQEETSRTTNGEIKVGKDHSVEGREVLKNILDQTGGEYFSLSELIPCLSFIQSRNVRSTAWKASLKIGTSLDIPICLYVKVKEMKFKNFKNVYSARADAEIERSREYHLIDDQQTEVDKSEVIEGHRYGTTLVPFSADDKEAMKVKTEKCFKVLGFTKAENVKRYQYVGDSVWMCLAEKGNEAAQISLSALINALYETNMVAIVRRVYMNGGAVKIGCLFPHIKAKYECLYYVELPFAEDLHQSTFKSLPVSNSTKKNAPSDDQLDVVDKLIDAMDMSCTTKEENNSEELLKPKYLFNPYLQHLFQCIEHKALHPNEHLPTLNPVISHSLQPPQCMVESSKHLLDKISQLFELKPNLENNNELVVDVTAGRLQEADAERSSTLEGFVSEISKSRNLQEACMQVHKNVLQFAADGTLQENKKIFDCFGYLRSESIKNKLCNHFNGLLHDLKKSLHGSSRSMFLSELSRKNQGIITKSECCSSTAGSDEAADFFQSTEEDVKPEHINIC